MCPDLGVPLTPAWKVQPGRVEEILPTLPAGYFDAVLSDPSYGYPVTSQGGSNWESTTPQVEEWTRLRRVLVPGAPVLAFGGMRKWHRVACAAEDAGFELNDMLMWVHNGGMCKGLDVSKGVDKALGSEREKVFYKNAGAFSQDKLKGKEGKWAAGPKPASDAGKLWNGWNSSLKAAMDPILVLFNPRDGSYANNALQHGVAGLNVDKTKIEGRWPTNLLFTHHEECFGPNFHSDCHPDCAVAEVNALTGGKASRLYFCGKVTPADRGVGNTHPTVKPRSLTQYLATLILPPPRTDRPRRLLVPFSGSGSEIIGALQAGWEQVYGIEMNPEYCSIAERRIAACLG